MKTRTLLVALVVGLAAAASPAAAQRKVGTTVGTVLQIEPSARIAAMGNAGVVAHGDVQAAYYNPAALGTITGGSASFTHSPWLADLRYNYAAVAFRLAGANTLSLAVTSMDSGEMDETVVAANPFTGNRFRVQDLAFAVGYGRQFTDRFSAGIQAKYWRQSIANTAIGALGFDVGVLYQLPFNARLGASLSNFGTRGSFGGLDLDVRYDGDPNTNGDNPNLPAELKTDRWALPVAFRVGLGMPVRLGESNVVNLSVDALQPSDNTGSMSLGAEWGFQDLFFVRGGYQNLLLDDLEGGPTLGGGLQYDLFNVNLKVDYAWNDFGRIGDAQRFTLSVGF